MASNKEFLAMLESLSENKIREHIASGAWSEPRKVRLAEELLRRKYQERLDTNEARRDASNFEQIRIARSAKNAAWAAAIAAIIAAIIAAVAAVIAYYSMKAGH